MAILAQKVFLKAWRQPDLGCIVVDGDERRLHLGLVYLVQLTEVAHREHEDPADGEANAGGAEAPQVLLLHHLFRLLALDLGEKDHVEPLLFFRHVREVVMIKYGRAIVPALTLLQELGFEPRMIKVLHLVLLHHVLPGEVVVVVIVDDVCRVADLAPVHRVEIAAWER